jgi:hypothetical protein
VQLGTAVQPCKWREVVVRSESRGCTTNRVNFAKKTSCSILLFSKLRPPLESPPSARLRLATAYSPPSASPSAGCCPPLLALMCPPLLALMCPPPPRLASPHPPRLRSWYRVSPFVLHQMPPSSPPSSSTNAASSGGRTPTRRSSELKMAL